MSTSSASFEPVTLLGLGAMGSALASALLKAPGPLTSNSDSDPPSSPTVTLTLWNRSTTRPIIATLTKNNPNATFQPSLAAALAASDTILICLLSYAAIDATLSSLGPNDALCGKTVINLSNGTPAEARRLAAHMRDAWGVARYIDGAVMATPEMVGTEASQIFYAGKIVDGGEETNEEKEEPWISLLAHLGEPIYFGTDPGAAAIQDLANLAAMYGLFVGVVTALGLVKRHARANSRAGDGVDSGKHKSLGQGLPSIQRFVRPLLGAILPLADHIAKEWDEGIEEGGPHPLLMQQVALQNILRACEEEGVDGGGLAYFAAKVEEAVREGGGEGGMTLVARKFVL